MTGKLEKFYVGMAGEGVFICSKDSKLYELWLSLPDDDDKLDLVPAALFDITTKSLHHLLELDSIQSDRLVKDLIMNTLVAVGAVGAAGAVDAKN